MVSCIKGTAVSAANKIKPICKAKGMNYHNSYFLKVKKSSIRYWQQEMQLHMAHISNEVKSGNIPKITAHFHFCTFSSLRFFHSEHNTHYFY